MAQVTIYLPDDLRDDAKAAGLNISKLAQAAIRASLAHLPEPTEQDRQAASVDPGCVPGHHVGNRKRLPYGNVCDACGGKWER